MRSLVLLCVASLAGYPASPLWDSGVTDLRGYYVESRSCDVFTGECVANGQVGLEGKEALLAWNVAAGRWNGVDLTGLSVIAAVEAANTLGNTYQDPYPARAVLIVDAAATPEQHAALIDLARAYGGKLTEDVVQVETASIASEMGTCDAGGCARIHAEGLAEIDTRCLKDGDHLCGNEKAYYPPLTNVKEAMPAVASVARFDGDGLGINWNDVDRRSAFVGAF